MRKKGIYFLFLFLTLISALFVFRKPLTTLGIKLAFKHFSEKSTGKVIHFDRLQFEKGTIQMSAFRFGNEGQIVRSGGLYLESEWATIRYHLDLFHRTLELYISFEKPYFTLAQGDDTLKSLKSLLENKFKLLEVKTFFNMNQAHLTLINEENSQSYPFHFEMREVNKNQRVAQINFYRDEGSVKTFLHHHEDILDLKVDVSDLNLESLVFPVDFTLGLLDKKQIAAHQASGLVNASMNVSFQEGYLPTTEIQFEGKNLIFQSQNQRVLASSPKLSGQLEILGHRQSDQKFNPKNFIDCLVQNGVGFLNVAKESKLSYQNGSSGWQADDLQGKFLFSNHRPTQFNLETQLSSNEQCSKLVFEGLGFFSLPRGDLNLKMQDPLGNMAQIRVSFDPLLDQKYKFFTQVSNLSEVEGLLLQKLLEPIFPESSTFDLKKGFLDARLRGTLINKKLSELTVDHFSLHNAYFNALGIVEDAKDFSVSGNLYLNFAQKEALRKCSTNLEFKTGYLQIKGHKLHDIEGKCHIKQGEVEYIKTKASLGGISAKLAWKKQAQAQPLSIQLGGQVQDFFPYLPASIAQVYEATLEDDSLKIELTGDYLKDKIPLTAKCLVNGQDQIELGFTLFQNESPKASSLDPSIWEKFIAPMRTLPAAFALKTKGAALQNFYEVKEGWFKAQNIPVEKYLRPLLFGNTTVQFMGKTDLQGTFDHHAAEFEYSNYLLQLDHADVAIEVQDQASSVGKHYFSFVHGTHFGTLDVKNGFCLIKGCDLLFENLSGRIWMTPDSIQSDSLNTLSNQISLNGEFVIQFLEDYGLDLKVKTKKVQGLYSNFKPFFNAFGESKITQIGLEGQIHIPKDQATFHLLKNENYQNELFLKGQLSEGKLPLNPSVQLSDLSANFIIDTQKAVFELEDLQGNWQVEGEKPLNIQANHFKIDLITHTPSPFDIRLKDAYKDQVRLKGKLALGNAGKNLLKIVLDREKSHIGALQIKSLTCNLQPDFKLDYLNLNFHENLFFLSKDLKILNQLFPVLSHSILTHLGGSPVTGDLFGQWLYHSADRQHQFFTWSDQIKWGTSLKSPLKIKGKYQGSTLVLEEFDYLQLKGSATLENTAESYLIKTMSFKVPQSFEIEYSGFYDKDNKSFEIPIHNIFGNLDELKKNPLFRELKVLSSSQGKFNVKGKLEGKLIEEGLDYGLKLEGQGSRLKVGEFLFSDEKLTATFRGTPGTITLESFDGGLAKAYGQPLNLNLIAHNIEVRRPLETCRLEKVQFKFPAKNLNSISQILTQQFKLKLAKEIFQIKKDGFVKGTFSMKEKDRKPQLNLNFEKDRYFFFDRYYLLENLHIEYGIAGLSILTQIQYEQYPYWLKFKKEAFSGNEILVALFDKDPNKIDPVEKPLTLNLIKTAKNQLDIESIHGYLAGVKLDFVSKPNLKKNHTLIGQVNFTSDEFIERLPKIYQMPIKKIGFGKGYFLSGQLQINPQEMAQMTFEGLLGGQDFSLLGYQFKSLSSDIKMTSKAIEIKDLKISDLAGEMNLDQMKLQKHAKKMDLSIHKVCVERFKPSLLRTRFGGILKHKPLIIDSFELTNLKGDLQNLETLTGAGALKFQKSPKKQASLLDIPVHLIAKLGLDLTMLNPVEGKICYEIKDKKIHFTKLLDVYSHDRNCHFQLAKSSGGSYLDFNGDLHVKIKMKQYVLLKITQPFIISIQGNCLNPKYSFTRKKQVVDVPEKIFP